MKVAAFSLMAQLLVVGDSICTGLLLKLKYFLIGCRALQLVMAAMMERVKSV
jgi:hypothetical protein